jgi:hypothetical protein
LGREEVRSALDEAILHRLRTTPARTWPETSREFENALTHAILCQECDLAETHLVERYFGPSRTPGTTSIGERLRNPEIFQDTTESQLETFSAWVYRSVAKILNRMQNKSYLPVEIELTPSYLIEVGQKIERMLSFKTPGGVHLYDAIPQQMYEDIFIRMVEWIIAYDLPESSFNFYLEFNAICHRIALALIDRLEVEGFIGDQAAQIAKIIQLAVLSGYVGINLKSSASAASTLLNRSFIPLKEEWIQSIQAVHAVSPEEINHVVDRLMEVSDQVEGQFGLESLAKYQAEVTKTHDPTLLVFFCDDYMESIVDMKRFEMLLATSQPLKILFIPRSGRYGNDIAYEDVDAILQASCFHDLKRFTATGRFHISPNGPKSGCIDPRFIDRKLIDEIRTLGEGKRVIFETKGCRNFEMLQGNLQIPWYAGFNCNRALSIRTVGIDGPPVFLRIPPGLRAYDQFTHPVIGPSRFYQTAQVRYARMTTKELYAALDSKIYQALLGLAEDELHLNTALTRLGDQLKLPFSELIALMDARQLRE